MKFIIFGNARNKSKLISFSFQFYYPHFLNFFKHLVNRDITPNIRNEKETNENKVQAMYISFFLIKRIYTNKITILRHVFFFTKIKKSFVIFLGSWGTFRTHLLFLRPIKIVLLIWKVIKFFVNYLIIFYVFVCECVCICVKKKLSTAVPYSDARCRKAYEENKQDIFALHVIDRKKNEKIEEVEEINRTREW